MKTDEIDDIIAKAVEESKGKSGSRWHHPSKKKMTTEKVRSILNTLFMLGFLAAIIIYFAFPESKVLFFSVGFGAMFLKIIEFIIRFMS